MDQYKNGFGNIIVPTDISREEYVTSVYKTYRCMAIDTYGNIMRNILIPIHLIDIIEIPSETEKYGSLIKWTLIEPQGQYAIDNVYKNGGDIGIGTEFTKTNTYLKQNNKKVYQSASVNRTPIVVTYIEGGGEGNVVGGYYIKVKSKSNKISEILVKDDGSVDLFSQTTMNLRSIGSIVVECGKDEKTKININESLFEIVNKNGKFTVDLDKISLDQEVIELGKDPNDQLVLGNKLKSILSDLITAITVMTMVDPLSGTTGVPTNIAQFEQIRTQLSNILSQVTKVK